MKKQDKRKRNFVINYFCDMEKYRVEKNGSKVTIWNDTDGIGLQFTTGDSLQRYNSSIVIRDYSLSTEAAVKHLNEVQEQLTEYAATLYPKEFTPLKTE